MNKVILMGRLTRDPEVRYSAGDTSMAFARYTIAVDRRFKREGEATADFIPCVAFGKNAEFAEKYLRQGTKIALTGRIQTGSYVNRDGQKVYTTDVVVEEQEFAESKAAAAGNSNAGNYGGYNNYNNYNNGNSYSAPSNNGMGQMQPQSAARANAYPKPEAAADGFMNIPDGIDEELPFA